MHHQGTHLNNLLNPFPSKNNKHQTTQKVIIAFGIASKAHNYENPAPKHTYHYINQMQMSNAYFLDAT